MLSLRIWVWMGVCLSSFGHESSNEPLSGSAGTWAQELEFLVYMQHAGVAGRSGWDKAV